MTGTIKQKVVETVLAAPKTKVQGRTYYAVDHAEILGLSACEDSATRRLREMASDAGTYLEHKNGKILVRPEFVKWLKKQ